MEDPNLRPIIQGRVQSLYFCVTLRYYELVSHSVIEQSIQESAWEAVASGPALPHRYGHTTSQIQGGLLVFGGWDGKQALSTIGQIHFR